MIDKLAFSCRIALNNTRFNLRQNNFHIHPPLPVRRGRGLRLVEVIESVTGSALVM